jgi:hypothetical protein
MSQNLVSDDDLGLKYEQRQFDYCPPKQELPDSGRQPEEGEIKYLSEVPYRPVEWIWEGIIPCNKLTLIEGPGESGKSLLAIDLFARLSRGEPMPGETGPGLEYERLVILSRQDDLHDTILPRIRRAGGKLDAFANFSNIGRRTEEDDEVFELRRGLRLPADIQIVADAVCNACGLLLLIDPLSSFCRSAYDFQRTIELLDDLASQMSMPILATVPAKTSRNRHRKWTTRPIFPDGPARCVWSIHEDPKDPGRRFFLPTRLTFGTPQPGMAFRIDAGRIAWEPLPDLSTYDDDETVDWLRTTLRDSEFRSRDVYKLAAEFGISSSEVRRAKEFLKVEHRREGFGRDMVCYWTLPLKQIEASTPKVLLTTVTTTETEPAERAELRIEG